MAEGWWAAGRPVDALRCGDEALQRLRSVGAWPPLIALAVGLADRCGVAGQAADGRRYLGEALAASAPLGASGEADVMIMLGQAAMQRGDGAVAMEAFSEAARRLNAAGLPLPPPLVAVLKDPGRSSWRPPPPGS